MAPSRGVPWTLRSWRSGWARRTAPRCPGESISGTTVMCRVCARARIRRTSALLRCWAETISGWLSEAIRKPWSSEKCSPNWLSLRSAISRSLASIQPAVKNLRAMSRFSPRWGFAGASVTTPSGIAPEPFTDCLRVRVP